MNNFIDDGYFASSEHDAAMTHTTVPPFIPYNDDSNNLQTRDNSLVGSSSLMPSRSASRATKEGTPRAQTGGNSTSVAHFNNCHYSYCTLQLSTVPDNNPVSGDSIENESRSSITGTQRLQNTAAAENINQSHPFSLNQQQFPNGIEKQFEEERRRNQGIIEENKELKELLDSVREKLETTEMELQECRLKLAHELGKNDALQSMVNELNAKDAGEASSRNEQDRFDMLHYKQQVEELQQKLTSTETECTQLREKLFNVEKLRDTLLSEKMKDITKSIENLEANIYGIDDAVSERRDTGMMYSHGEVLHYARSTDHLNRHNQNRSSTTEEDATHQCDQIISRDQNSANNGRKIPATDCDHGTEHRGEDYSSVKTKKSLKSFFLAILHRKKMKKEALQAMLETNNNVKMESSRRTHDYESVEDAFSSA